MRYQLRDKDPTTLKKVMETVEKIDKNMQSSEKSIIPNFTKDNTSILKPHDAKGKAIKHEDKDQGKEPIKKVADMIKQMMINCTSQMNAMQIG